MRNSRYLWSNTRAAYSQQLRVKNKLVILNNRYYFHRTINVSCNSDLKITQVIWCVDVFFFAFTFEAFRYVTRLKTLEEMYLL